MFLLPLFEKQSLYYSLAATLPNLSGTPSSPPCNRASPSAMNQKFCTLHINNESKVLREINISHSFYLTQESPSLICFFQQEIQKKFEAHISPMSTCIYRMLWL